MMANDGKQWQTMANKGKQWQTKASDGEQRFNNNRNSKLYKKQQSTIGNGNSDSNSNSKVETLYNGKGGDRKIL